MFFAHGYIHNVIIIFFGFIYLFYIKKKKFIEYKILILLFLILFISFIFSKNNEDFPYYHLPNSIQFAQQKLQFGLGNLNHGFKHISSLFMLMSLNYLPFFEHYLFNITNFLFLLFFTYFLIYEIFFKKNLNLNFSQIIIYFISQKFFFESKRKSPWNYLTFFFKGLHVYYFFICNWIWFYSN